MLLVPFKPMVRTLLPKPVKDLHRPGERAIFRGETDIEGGLSPLAAIIRAVFRFPKPGAAVPTTVEFTVKDNVETWKRCFGGRSMISTQGVGRGRHDRLVVERFGPVAFGIAMTVEEGRLFNRPQCWSIFGIPMPQFLLPGGDIFEHAEGGRFNFHVSVDAPLIGRIVKYQGWLKPD